MNEWLRVYILLVSVYIMALLQGFARWRNWWLVTATGASARTWKTRAGTCYSASGGRRHGVCCTHTCLVSDLLTYGGRSDFSDGQLSWSSRRQLTGWPCWPTANGQACRRHEADGAKSCTRWNGNASAVRTESRGREGWMEKRKKGRQQRERERERAGGKYVKKGRANSVLFLVSLFHPWLQWTCFIVL